MTRVTDAGWRTQAIAARAKATAAAAVLKPKQGAGRESHLGEGARPNDRRDELLVVLEQAGVQERRRAQHLAGRRDGCQHPPRHLQSHLPQSEFSGKTWAMSLLTETGTNKALLLELHAQAASSMYDKPACLHRQGCRVV